MHTQQTILLYIKQRSETAYTFDVEGVTLTQIVQHCPEQSAERTAYKKEADRLSRLAQQKRDSQRTVQRYLQNEQAAKRKKGQLE